jgi:HAD superfamily hydrolase (TIGR01484 family)
VAQPQISLVYVTGRHKELVEEAIAAYDLPIPDAVISDVGATLYHLSEGNWQPSQAWRSHIAADWQGKTGPDLHRLLGVFSVLQLQEAEKQGPHKLSYYFPTEESVEPLRRAVQERLTAAGLAATLITSIDEAEGIGLLDILPPRANKLRAIEFFMAQAGVSLENTLFAGDSGNDLSVLASPIPAVVVANARPEVKQEAAALAAAAGWGDRLYLAQGNTYAMNGNYSAGILEGAAHYFPEVAHWLTQQTPAP